MSAARSGRYVPHNSLGEPWRTGQRWTCSRCGQGGDDRDDVAHPGCTTGPNPPHRQWHELVFEPTDHHAAIVARRGAA